MRGNSNRIQHRRGTASQWTVTNPVLLAGELGYETDTTRLKFGDGGTQWSALPYVGAYGSPDLGGLTDVSITSPAAGSVLRYDGAAWTDYVLAKADLQLGNVDNTSDLNKPISTATQAALDGKASASDSRLSDARTPLSHSHGNITNAGAIGTTSGQIVVTTTGGVLTTSQTILATQVYGLANVAISGSFVNLGGKPTTLSGYGITDAVATSDSRLSDTRVPTDLSVTTAKIADGAVTTAKLADGAVATVDIANSAVTYAKIQNVSVTDRLLGRSTAGAGVVEEIVCTAYGRSLIDDADAATARTTLGLGTIATQASSSVTITGGTINGSSIGSTTASTGAFTTLTTTGNVGIGTANPPEKLSVFADNNAGRTSILIDNLDQRLKFSAYYESGIGQYAEIQSINNAETSQHALLLNRQGGNVGIGTANPGSKLEVIPGGGQGINCVNNGGAGTTNYAVMAQSAGSASHNTGLYVNTFSATYNYGIRIINPPAAATNWAIYSDATAQSYFAGNVGIGTASPQNRLHVDSASSFSPLSVGGSDAVSGIQFRNTGATLGYIYYDTTPSMIFHVAASEKMRILTNGNVGIATASPSISSGAGLHIGGSTMRLDTARTPASSTATGNTGEHCWDSNYFYVCVATNSWKRIALSSF